jgi:hypothetical protein
MENSIPSDRKKKCIGCKDFKVIQDFSEDKSRPDGREYYCKDCRKEHQRMKYAKEILNKGAKRCIGCRVTKELSEYPKDNRTRDGAGLFCIQCCNGEESVKAQEEEAQKVQKKFTISRRSIHKLRSVYGITEQEYLQLFEEQKGVCAICGRPEKESRFRLSVDHSHTTGKIRALLCNACNTGLGHFEENIEYLQRAIKYLQEHQ